MKKRCLREIVTDNSQAKGNETNFFVLSFHLLTLIPQATHIPLVTGWHVREDEAPLVLRNDISIVLP
jgi:hypothetical protein